MKIYKNERKYTERSTHSCYTGLLSVGYSPSLLLLTLDDMYSVFGTSQPDLAFFKASQGNIVAGIVDVQDEGLGTEECVELVQNTIEYKSSTEKDYRTQCYANLVRVANDSVIE